MGEVKFPDYEAISKSGGKKQREKRYRDQIFNIVKNQFESEPHNYKIKVKPTDKNVIQGEDDQGRIRVEVFLNQRKHGAVFIRRINLYDEDGLIKEGKGRGLE